MKKEANREEIKKTKQVSACMEERTTNSNRQQRRAVCYEQGRGRRRRERDVMKEKMKHRREIGRAHV